MGYNLIEITHDKVEDLSENIEKGLRYIGKAMQCIDELKQQSGMMGQRRWGNQYGSGRMYHRGDMGMRDDEMGYRGSMGYRQPDPEMGYRGSMGYRHPDYQDPMMY